MAAAPAGAPAGAEDVLVRWVALPTTAHAPPPRAFGAFYSPPDGSDNNTAFLVGGLPGPELSTVATKVGLAALACSPVDRSVTGTADACRRAAPCHRIETEWGAYVAMAGNTCRVNNAWLPRSCELHVQVLLASESKFKLADLVAQTSFKLNGSKAPQLLPVARVGAATGSSGYRMFIFGGVTSADHVLAHPILSAREAPAAAASGVGAASARDEDRMVFLNDMAYVSFGDGATAPPRCCWILPATALSPEACAAAYPEAVAKVAGQPPCPRAFAQMVVIATPGGKVGRSSARGAQQQPSTGCFHSVIFGGVTYCGVVLRDLHVFTLPPPAGWSSPVVTAGPRASHLSLASAAAAAATGDEDGTGTEGGSSRAASAGALLLGRAWGSCVVVPSAATSTPHPSSGGLDTRSLIIVFGGRRARVGAAALPVDVMSPESAAMHYEDVLDAAVIDPSSWRVTGHREDQASWGFACSPPPAIEAPGGSSAWPPLRAPVAAPPCPRAGMQVMPVTAQVQTALRSRPLPPWLQRIAGMHARALGAPSSSSGAAEEVGVGHKRSRAAALCASSAAAAAVLLSSDGAHELSTAPVVVNGVAAAASASSSSSSAPEGAVVPAWAMEAALASQWFLVFGGEAVASGGARGGGGLRDHHAGSAAAAPPPLRAFGDMFLLQVLRAGGAMLPLLPAPAARYGLAAFPPPVAAAPPPPRGRDLVGRAASGRGSGAAAAAVGEEEYGVAGKRAHSGRGGRRGEPAYAEADEEEEEEGGAARSRHGSGRGGAVAAAAASRQAAPAKDEAEEEAGADQDDGVSEAGGGLQNLLRQLLAATTASSGGRRHGGGNSSATAALGRTSQAHGNAGGGIDTNALAAAVASSVQAALGPTLVAAVRAEAAAGARAADERVARALSEAADRGAEASRTAGDRLAARVTDAVTNALARAREGADSQDRRSLAEVSTLVTRGLGDLAATLERSRAAWEAAATKREDECREAQGRHRQRDAHELAAARAQVATLESELTGARAQAAVAANATHEADAARAEAARQVAAAGRRVADADAEAGRQRAAAAAAAREAAAYKTQYEELHTRVATVLGVGGGGGGGAAGRSVSGLHPGGAAAAPAPAPAAFGAYGGGAGSSGVGLPYGGAGGLE